MKKSILITLATLALILGINFSPLFMTKKSHNNIKTETLSSIKTDMYIPVDVSLKETWTEDVNEIFTVEDRVIFNIGTIGFKSLIDFMDKYKEINFMNGIKEGSFDFSLYRNEYKAPIPHLNTEYIPREDTKPWYGAGLSTKFNIVEQKLNSDLHIWVDEKSLDFHIHIIYYVLGHNINRNSPINFEFNISIIKLVERD